ncbi:hypothetical protein NFJ02_33g83510 [Pycnococcus provasolii]
MVAGKLSVTVHGADGLRGPAGLGSTGEQVDGPTHPYCVLRVGPDALHTGVALAGGVSPTFGETLTFMLHEGCTTASLEVFDANHSAAQGAMPPGTNGAVAPRKAGCMTGMSRTLALLSVGEPLDSMGSGQTGRGGVGDRASLGDDLNDAYASANDNPLYETGAASRADLCGSAVVALSGVFHTWVSPAMRVSLEGGGEVTLSLVFVPCKREGYLFRQRLSGASWDRYWFALMADGRLCYYTKPSKMWHEQRGVIRLETADRVGLSEKRPSGVAPECCFELAGRDCKRGNNARTYYMQARSADEGRAWLHDLESMHVLATRPL